MVLRILPVLLLTLILSDVYLYFKFMYGRRHPLWAYFLFFLPNALLLIAALILTWTENHTPENMTQMVIFFSLYMLIALPKMLFLLVDLIGKGICLFFPRAKKVCTMVSSAASLLLLCIMGAGLSFGPTLLQVRHTNFSSADLPTAFDGYRIVQISDIHIGSWQGNPDPIKQLVDLVNGQKPDLIVFTGDLVNQQSHELDGFQEILSQLYAPDGVYSILGNHDYGSYYHWQSPKAEIANLDYLIRQQKAMGWKLLNNEHDILHHKGDSIALIGVENDGEPPFSQFADLPQAMQGTEGMFQILLSHNPTHWRREVLPRSDISLMLAGHTHAMQGILFGHSLAELIYPEWRGMYYEGKRALYVNIGIGYVGLPFRFGAWPEITVLKLVREKE